MKNQQKAGEENSRQFETKNPEKTEMEVNKPAAESSENSPDENPLLKKLNDAESKAAEYFDSFQRTLAEFDNFRKRTIKEKSASYDDGAAAVLLSFLPILDNMERALTSSSEDDKKTALFMGLDLIYKQLTDILSLNNVKAIEAKGETFNPSFHSAIAHVDDEAFGVSEIVEDMQKGYMYKDRVLRHSIVKVAN